MSCDLAEIAASADVHMCCTEGKTGGTGQAEAAQGERQSMTHGNALLPSDYIRIKHEA
jgi:hypothetical protein